ncbi:MAG: hypothetical protein WBL23_08240 [Salinisphaera sp.]|uniref:hypothetical protein n=1 Tax=Salinisphaera sp. TaxID=1914330 RepID=UPI003C7C4150
MARHRMVQAPAWQGCQLREAKQALEERRRRLREAAKAFSVASLGSPDRITPK